MNKIPKDRIERIKYLAECAKLYETNGTSPLTDEEYDKSYAELKELGNSEIWRTGAAVRKLRPVK